MVGQVIDYAGRIDKIDASKWKLCNGQLLPTAEFPELFDAIGNIYGGNGTTGFRLPSCGQKVIVGYKEDDNTYILGNTGGSEKVVLTSGQLPNFSMSLAGQRGGFNADNYKAFQCAGKLNESSFDFNLEAEYKRNKSEAEYGQSHENMPPYIVMIKLIRYKL